MKKENKNTSPLYNPEAVARLRTDERLDIALPLVTPAVRWGIVAVLLLLISITLWSIFGSFTTRVRGLGMIVERSPATEYKLTGLFFVPADQGKNIEPGMEINVNVSGFDVFRFGRLVGKVNSVSQYPVSLPEMMNELKNEQMANDITSQLGGTVMQVGFEPVRAPTRSGYLWTMSKGADKALTAGSFCRGFVIIDQQSPMEWLREQANLWWGEG